jgi:hypothetical protein
VEKIEMAELEKKVESRAQVLLDKAAVKIPAEMAMTGGIEEAMMRGREETEKISSTPSTDEEIDWENVWASLDKPTIPTISKEKQSGMVTVRRSERNKHDMGKIQDKAEALKKKKNDTAGNTSSSTILNSVEPSFLAKLALASNIKLGDDPGKINASISTIQAKELAKVALMKTKKRLEDKVQVEKSDLEGGPVADALINAELQADPEKGSKHRPPKKPPKKRGRPAVRDREGVAAECSHN